MLLLQEQIPVPDNRSVCLLRWLVEGASPATAHLGSFSKLHHPSSSPAASPFSFTLPYLPFYHLPTVPITANGTRSNPHNQLPPQASTLHLVPNPPFCSFQAFIHAHHPSWLTSASSASSSSPSSSSPQSSPWHPHASSHE